MREILFRGKRVDNGEWVYGNYIKSPTCQDLHMIEDTSPLIMDDGCRRFQGCPPVDPATAGQYTGLTDKNGKKIFEGDIIEADNRTSSSCFIVKFGEYYPKMFFSMMDRLGYTVKHIPAVGFYGESLGKGEEIILFQSPCVTVIGNIHDNPELLEDYE